MNKKQQREEAKRIAAEKAAEQTQADAAIDNETAPGQTDVPPVETAPAKKAKKEPKAMVVTLPDGTVKTLPTLPAGPKKARKPKAGKPCACGCGAMTKGGRFVTGHDSYLKSWCLRVERGVVALADIPDDGIRAAVRGQMLDGNGPIDADPKTGK